jgi:hypothetical protein
LAINEDEKSLRKAGEKNGLSIKSKSLIIEKKPTFMTKNMTKNLPEMAKTI